MDVFTQTRRVLDHGYTLRWQGASAADPRFVAIRRALNCLKRLHHDDYVEACYEFHFDSLPGGPYPSPSVQGTRSGCARRGGGVPSITQSS